MRAMRPEEADEVLADIDRALSMRPRDAHQGLMPFSVDDVVNELDNRVSSLRRNARRTACLEGRLDELRSLRALIMARCES